MWSLDYFKYVKFYGDIHIFYLMLFLASVVQETI